MRAQFDHFESSGETLLSSRRKASCSSLKSLISFLLREDGISWNGGEIDVLLGESRGVREECSYCGEAGEEIRKCY